jgi:acetylornithine deacetylase
VPHALLDDAVSILGDLVAFESVSSQSNLELIAYVNRKLDQIGTRTYLTLDPSGHKANLFATLGPPEQDGGVILSGHTDVVPVDGQEWTAEPFRTSTWDDRVYGRGTCDMKGFLACAMAFAPMMAEAGLRRPLHLAFTYDEEVGCLGAQVMLKELAETGRRPAICIVGEPTEMRIIEGNKGCCEYTTTFVGTEGHASQPDLGVNAVEYAVRYVGRLMEIAEALRHRAPENSRFDPPWSTLQIGRLAGGVARNIIARNCSVDWELRPVSAQDYHFAKTHIQEFVEVELLPRMRSIHPDATILTEVIGEVAGLEPMDVSEAEQLVRTLTGNDAKAECVSFGTEAGLYQQYGISTVICGPGSIHQAHKADEYIALSQMDACLDMIGALGKRLVEDPVPTA